MNWTDLLKSEIDAAYGAADGLLSLVDDLDWKPATGDNWMSTGQLLQHMTDACGGTFRGFVTGDWGMPEGVDMDNLTPEQMMPAAETLPTTDSVETAREALRADKNLALSMIEEAADRMGDPAPAPWNPQPVQLGQQLLGMVNHLNQHKGQLFYYLKLQGKPVNTMHYYGMASEPAAS